MISEFVVDHVGNDTHEFIEIFGLDRTDYFHASLLVLDGEANPGQVLAEYPVGTTGSAGFWSTAFLEDELPNTSLTLLCVLDFSGSVGMDLDADDDGVFNVTPWSELADDLALDYGGAGDRVYSSVVFDVPAMRQGGAPFGGASRDPYGLDSDQLSDWVVNDFDGAGLPGFVGLVESGEAFNTPGGVTNVHVADYYASADTSSSQALRESVHDIIDDHARFPYTSSFTDTWNVLNLADENPTQSNQILSVYKNISYAKETGGNSNYNREHTWPKSYGFPDDGNSNSAYTDCHHLRLSNISANSHRGNIAFGNCNAGCDEETTVANNGEGGGSGSYPGNSNWYSGSGGSGHYEVWHFRRGDVARSMLYFDVRYEGDMHQIRQTLEPDLILTDNTALIQTTGVNVTGPAYMGRLSVLLQWHQEDPVDDMERARNEVVYAFQGNRNPFVDHPEWVDCIFNDNCDQPCLVQLYADWLEGLGPCSGETLSVSDYIAFVNGDCSCR